MTTLYFKTEKDTETGEKIKALLERGLIGAAQAKQFCKKVGAEENYLRNDRYIFGTGLRAVTFQEEPDLKNWKRFKGWDGYFSPRLSTKEGKELGKQIDEMESVEKTEIGEAIGLEDFFKSPGFTNGNLFFGFAIKDEWNLKMPSDCIEITGTEYSNL